MSGEAEGAPKEAKKLTKSAYLALRRDIIEGSLAPGAKLRAGDLRLRYHVSGSTMREAFARLISEALVVNEGQRGFRVAPVSIEEFQDMSEARQLVEAEALRQSIAAGGDEWESGIVAAFYRLSRAQERLADDPIGSVGDFEARSQDFNEALIAACPSRWLRMLCGLLVAQSERYHRIALTRQAIPGDIHAALRKIMEAALARDADGACALTAEHAASVLASLRAILAPEA